MHIEDGRRLGKYALIARRDVDTWAGIDPADPLQLVEIRRTRATRDSPQNLVHRSQLSFGGVLEVRDTVWSGDFAWTVVDWNGGPALWDVRDPRRGRGAPPREILLALFDDVITLVIGDPRPLSLAFLSSAALRIRWDGTVAFDPVAPFPGIENPRLPGVLGPRIEEFFSPEQVVGHRTDERSDVFVLGVTLYNLLLRRSAFDVDGSEFQMLERIRAVEVAPFSLDGNVGPQLETLLRNCLLRAPEDRPTSPHVLKRQLQEMRRELPAVTRADISGFLQALFADDHARDVQLQEHASLFAPEDIEELSELEVGAPVLPQVQTPEPGAPHAPDGGANETGFFGRAIDRLFRR